MATVPITINVDEEVAKAYTEASTEDRLRIEMLLSLHLHDFIVTPPRPLREVIKDISARAEARGLTPEILESILRGHDD